MKYCPRCGTQAEDNAQFCMGCGYRLGQTQANNGQPRRKKVQPQQVYGQSQSNNAQSQRTMEQPSAYVRPSNVSQSPGYVPQSQQIYQQNYNGGSAGYVPNDQIPEYENRNRRSKRSRGRKNPKTYKPKRKGGFFRFLFRIALILGILFIGLKAFRYVNAIRSREVSDSLDVSAYKDLSLEETTSRIAADYHKILEEYTNAEGYLKDVSDLEESSQAVYDWGQELKNVGVIEECMLCETSQTVAFWIDDVHCEIYIPQLEDTYSGTGNQGAVNSYQAYSYDAITVSNQDAGPFANGTMTPAASTRAAKKIASLDEYEYAQNSITEYWGTSVATSNNEIDQIKELLRNMNSTQVFFWTSHGCLYYDQSGRLLVAFVTNTYSSCNRYQEDYDHGFLVVSDNRYAVNTLFFDEYLAQCTGGLFYTGACYSACDGGTLAQIFLNHGFDAYVGSDGSINQLYCNSLMKKTAEYLIRRNDSGQYNSIEEALELAKDECGYSDWKGVSSVCYEDSDGIPYRVVGMGVTGADEPVLAHASLDGSDRIIVNMRPYEWLIPFFKKHIKIYVMENYSSEDMNEIRRRVSLQVMDEYDNDILHDKYDVVVVKCTKKLQDEYDAGNIMFHDEIGDIEIHNLEEWWHYLCEYIGYLFSMNTIWTVSDL